MSQVETRLEKCFAAVFPELPPSKISAASQETVRNWDSLATATLMNVIEEEFGLTLDLDELTQLTSFASVGNLLKARIGG